MAKKKVTGRAMFRQGDVLLIADDKVKAGKEIVPQGTRVVLAIGETSGHCHAVDSDRAKLFELARGEEAIEAIVDRVLVITSKATMRVEGTTSRARQDERHTPIELPPGNYRVRVMREFHPEMLRSVED